MRHEIPDKTETQRYVLGFLVDSGYVVLIRKDHPEWQKGKLNGVGGKIIPFEHDSDAMIREFREETGRTVLNWNKFAIMKGEGWEVVCFWSTGILSRCKTQESEEVEIHNIKGLSTPYRKDVIENLPFLLSMIESQKTDGVEFYTR